MSLHSETIDVSLKLATLAASAASGTAAVMTRDLAVEYLGVPLPVLLAAFAGAGLILSFLPPRETTRWRIASSVAFCTLLAAWSAHRLTDWIDDYIVAFAAADILVAFSTAAVLQIVMPIVIADPKGAIDALRNLLPRWGGKP